MQCSASKPQWGIIFFSMLAGLVLTSSCRPATEANVNANANTNANVNTNLNANTAAESLAVIAAREPEKYQATLVLSAETEGGEKTIGIPTLSANVARNGDDRRVSFKLPDGAELIYIDKDNHHYVMLPARKQYAELTPEAVGFQIQKLMTPGQLVSHLQKLKGIEHVSEEQLNGRTAEKYRYTRTVKTDTQAGEVKNDAFVYVDKDTGLPLRAELFVESSGEVKGVKAAKIVAEMRDITTNVDVSQFDINPAYSRIPPEQIRAQVDSFTNTVAAVIKTLLTNLNVNATPGIVPSPTSSPSPSPTGRP